MKNELIYLVDFYDNYDFQYEKSYYILNFKSAKIYKEYNKIEASIISGYFAVDRFRINGSIFPKKFKLGYFTYENKDYLYIDDRIFLQQDVKILEVKFLLFFNKYIVKTPLKTYNIVLSLDSEQDILCTNILENIYETVYKSVEEKQ